METLRHGIWYNSSEDRITGIFVNTDTMEYDFLRKNSDLYGKIEVKPFTIDIIYYFNDNVDVYL